MFRWNLVEASLILSSDLVVVVWYKGDYAGSCFHEGCLFGLLLWVVNEGI